MPDQVIELSVDETNDLRAKLGLKPLRTSAPPPVSKDEQVLSLSVDETNNFRRKLGLDPLKSADNFIHKPAENPAAAQEAADRIEDAKLKQLVAQGIAKFAANPSLAENDDKSISDWARRLKNTRTASTKTASKPKESTTPSEYHESDLQGLHVAHNASELAENSTVVMTLADSSLIREDVDSQKALGLSHDEAALENASLRDAQTQEDGLKRKRQLEMGMGRAGGYAGFDDDEFVELGGTKGPSRSMRRGEWAGAPEESGSKKGSRGFQIGDVLEDAAKEEESDLFSTKAISLQPSAADTQASDYMTIEEEQALKPKKKKSKDTTFKKKEKKKKKEKRKELMEESENEAESSISFLESLRKTAPETKANTRKRGLAAADDDDKDGQGGNAPTIANASTNQSVLDRRKKYKAVMEKGNQRSKAIFASAKPVDGNDEEETEADDAFLNAALSKARRLNRLKNLSKKKGADAVVETLHNNNNNEGLQPDVANSNKTIAFSVDETREFTRALQARAAQKSRKSALPAAVDDPPVRTDTDPIKAETVDEDNKGDDMDLEELAKEVKEEKDEPTSAGLVGATGTDVSLGRGIAGMLGFLQESGELSRKNAGKEEMRGRARDERTYEDYDDLDLRKVVKLDERHATEKDKEMAKKQIKLEYRDKYGRLQTRRDAYRDMSQQFHGFKGSTNKRKEERKLKQIAGEHKQSQAASRQAGEGGILGALRATQQATGKAYIVHKT